MTLSTWNNSQEFKTSSGKYIYSYENLFSFDERARFHNFGSMSLYKINGSDDFNYDDNNQIFSNYTEVDLDHMGFKLTEGFRYLESKHILTKRKIKKIRMNCCTPFEKANIHSDQAGITLLYYVNREWNINWMGHTMFFDESLSKVEYTSLYKPGKVVVFDGDIPHMVATQNYQSKGNRLSFVIQYGDIQYE